MRVNLSRNILPHPFIALGRKFFPISNQYHASLFFIKNLSSSVGGAERVLTQVASSLAERRYEVIVVTFDPIGSSSFYPLSPKEFINLPSATIFNKLTSFL